MFRLIVAALFICSVSCQLSEPDRKLVRESWAPYHNGNPTETGVAIFLAFFTAHPEIQQDFPKFKDIPLAELKALPAFQAHATKIFHVIDDAIFKKNWSDVEALSQFHADRGITDKAKFNAFRAVFINFLNLNAAQTAAWNQALDKFFHHLFIKF